VAEIPFSPRFCPKGRSFQKKTSNFGIKVPVSQSHVMSAKTGYLHCKLPFTTPIVFSLGGTRCPLIRRKTSEEKVTDSKVTRKNHKLERQHFKVKPTYH